MLDAPQCRRFIDSEEGRKLLASNRQKIDVAILRRYPSLEIFYRYKAGYDRTADEAEGAIPASALQTCAPDEQIGRACEAMNEAPRSDLLIRIAHNSPTFFEDLIIELLLKMRCGGSFKDAAKHLGRSGHGGVISEDRQHLDRIYVQAKRYAADNIVGRPAVQKFVGGLVGFGAKEIVLVAASNFNPQARQFVERLSHRVILIDGQCPADMMIEAASASTLQYRSQSSALMRTFFARRNKGQN